jgi:hypothetical protein
MTRTWSLGGMVLVLVGAACGGGTPPAQTPDEAPPKPAAALPAAAESAAPAASAAAPKAEAPKKAEAPGKPLATYEHQTQPVTIGRDGAIIRADNGGELRIPSDSIIEPRNILLIVDRKGKSSAGRIGEVYNLPVVLPNAQYKVGEELPSEPYETANGTPFVLNLPLPAGAMSASLAIEKVSLDAKKKMTSTWTIVAMKSVESGDKASRAVFEITALPGAHVHLTTAAPSAP